jgi:carbamate kinase
LESNQFITLKQLEIMSTEENNTEANLLEHAVINQLEADFDDQDFDSMSETIGLLLKNEEAKKILIEYLGDTAKENWLEGRTNVRY